MPEFSQIEGDPIDGAETMGLMNLTQNDLVDPVRFSKISDIIDYFKHDQNKSFTLTKLLVGKPLVDRVEHVWQYIGLKRDEQLIREKHLKLKEEFNALQEQLKQREKQLSYYE